MKAFISKGMSVAVRGGLVGSLVSIVGNSVIADQPAVDKDSLPSPTTHEDELVWDEGQDENRPVLELDPERGYASEALLSFRSKIAPYGKVLGIRRSKESEFRAVQVWKDIEEFVAGCEDDRVMVKVREPWGTELVVTVTINRIRYPNRVRPSVEPPTSPAKPVEPPAHTKPTAPVPISKPSEVAATTPPEPKVSVERVPLEVKPHASAATTSTSSPGNRFLPEPLEPKGIAISPRDPFVAPAAKPVARPVLSATSPSAGAPTGGFSEPSYRTARVDPQAIAIVPSSPIPAAPKIATMPVAEPETDFQLTALLALAPMIPIPAGIKELVGSEFSFTNVKVVGPNRKPPVRSVVATEFAMSADQETWLRDAVEMADRMGILSAKPMVTSDRRQNAFALYSLFMALKDYRFEVELSSRQLDEALGSGSGKMGPHRIEAMTRSVEKGMSSIMRWDTRKMESAIRNYSSELSTMGDVRRMVTFLASMHSISREKKGRFKELSKHFALCDG